MALRKKFAFPSLVAKRNVQRNEVRKCKFIPSAVLLKNGWSEWGRVNPNLKSWGMISVLLLTVTNMLLLR